MVRGLHPPARTVAHTRRDLVPRERVVEDGVRCGCDVEYVWGGTDLTAPTPWTASQQTPALSYGLFVRENPARKSVKTSLLMRTR